MAGCTWLDPAITETGGTRAENASRTVTMTFEDEAR
jgi:hypothetical protein